MQFFMQHILSIALVFLMLPIIWGLPLWAAVLLRRGGDEGAMGKLRRVWPAQLLAVALLGVVVELAGLMSPSGFTVIAICFVVSIGGGAWMWRRRGRAASPQ